MENLMEEQTRSPGKTTIAPEVLLNIARLTTLEVKGVNRMSGQSGVNELFQRGHRAEGVRIKIMDGTVDLDLHVVLDQDINIRQVSRKIQEEVARAITEMVGMEIGEINVHIEDIYYDQES
jgi:uncharacterized alkaline shock family protein YloU